MYLKSLNLKVKALAVLALVTLYIVLLTPVVGIHSVAAISTEDTYIKV